MTFHVRQAYRSLLRAPGLAGISVLTVALGVGAGTSLFSVVKAVLLNPLPFPESQRLAWISEVDSKGAHIMVALDNFGDWRAQNRSFQSMAAFSGGMLNAGGGEAAQRARGSVVTEDFFRTIGVLPTMGRGFSEAENQMGARSVILGHALWQRGYGSDPRVIGRGVRIVGIPFTVVGVMPAGFNYPDGTEVWIPWGAFQEGKGRNNHSFQVVGRLRPGVSIEQAQADMRALAHGLKERFPGPLQSPGASVISLRSHIGGDVRPAILMLFGAVGFLLLIVCMNVANLLIVRLAARTREIALRMALGAGWRDVLQQLLTESLLLGFAGGLLGLLMAFWSIDLIRILLPAGLPGGASIRIDGGVLGFALALSAAAGILFGLLPAWKAARLQVNEHLKAGSRTQTAGRHTQRAQRALVVSEVCLSLVLVAGAALLIHSLWKLRAIDPGFRTDRVISANLSFPVVAGDSMRLIRTYADVLRAVSAVPGVETAGAIKDLPLDSVLRSGRLYTENPAALPPTAEAVYQIASPGYFETMRIPLLRGRGLSDADTADAPPVAVINAELARRLESGRDPIGQRIRLDGFSGKPQWLTIVGIAGDVRHLNLSQPALPQAYVHYAQVAIRPLMMNANLVLRTSVDAASLTAEVRRRIRAIDPEGAVSFQTMDDVVRASLAVRRFQTQILGGFAALALLLAAVGLYGVLSYMVASNRAEIGIRMALGAQPATVFRMIAGRALVLAVSGIALGMGAYLALRQALAKLLYGVGPGDPPTLVAAAALLLAVAMVASWLPARRAMRMNPVEALRDE